MSLTNHETTEGRFLRVQPSRALPACLKSETGAPVDELDRSCPVSASWRPAKKHQ